jgi:predicted RNA binding protein YcfA (HicA-like mRNA interferase family)
MPGIVSVDWKRFEKFLKFVGCMLVREKGDHRIWSRTGLRRPVVIPRSSTIPVFVIRNNIRVLGISVAEYLEIMGKV